MSLVCDSINMCKEREDFLEEMHFKTPPNFCPFCGKKWYETAISEYKYRQVDLGNKMSPEWDDLTVEDRVAIRLKHINTTGGLP